MKASVFVAISVDGFIARKNGDVDWLPSGETENGEDYGYQEFFDSVDALVMGRNTYDLVASFSTWPYADKPVFVLSSRKLVISDELSKTVSAMNAEPKDVVRVLAERGYQHLYVDGGRTIQAFLAAGLIQKLIITKIPILIGGGIPLFGELREDVHLHHINSRHYENGLVQDTYEIC